MFLSLNNLNEGGAKQHGPGSKRREFYEGENPKPGINTSGWQAAKEKCHVNSNWQKLRK